MLSMDEKANEIYEILIHNGFNPEQIQSIAELIGHKWMIDQDFRIPTIEDIKNQALYQIKQIMKSDWYKSQNHLLPPIESYAGGIHVRCKFFENPFEYRWEMYYIPIGTSSIHYDKLKSSEEF